MATEEPISQKDFLEAVKTLFTKVKQLLGEQEVNFKSLLEERTRELRAAFTKELEVHTKRLEGVSLSFKGLEGEFKGMEGNTAARLGGMFNKMVSDKAVEMHSSYEQRMLSLQGTYEKGLEQVKSILQALPTPQVNVNVPELKVPTVNVHVPEQPSPHVNVTVPETILPAPQVNVNVPKQLPPRIDVRVPPPRKTVKNITYDQQGRPVHIEEREVD